MIPVLTLKPSHMVDIKAESNDLKVCSVTVAHHGHYEHFYLFILVVVFLGRKQIQLHVIEKKSIHSCFFFRLIYDLCHEFSLLLSGGFKWFKR